MSIRHLDALFAPRSIAVLGASDRPNRIGTRVWQNLAGHYRGPLFAVNPRRPHLGAAPVFGHLSELPQAPDLAIICAPAARVPGLIAELGAMGSRAAVVVSDGLDAAGRQAMLEAARPYTLRILGPNCLGLLVPRLGLNASFAHTTAQPGHLALVSQSGALVTAMLDWAQAHDVGFSHFVSLGDQADVDMGDMLDYLGSDPWTRAILLHIESIESPRKFMSAARAAARNKPVIVVKTGRSAAGQRAATSHSGALMGSDAVFDAALARAGTVRVDSLHDLFLAAELLARFRDNRFDRLLVLTNGGGAGVMAADAAASHHVPLTELSAPTLERLEAVLPPGWSHHNPVDIGDNAPPERYAAVLDALLQEERRSAILLIQAPTALVPSEAIADAVLPLLKGRPPQLLCNWLGEAAVEAARQRTRSTGVPDYHTPEQAVRAFALLRQYHRHQLELLETPSASPGGQVMDLDSIRHMIQHVLSSGREWLYEPESKQLLEWAGIAATPTRVVPPEPEATLYAAQTVGYPVVLKILSPDIQHKSDVGGVRLNLHDAEELLQAARSMLDRVAASRPGARIEGFCIQPMVQRRHTHELIVGASIDPLFGPVIVFGQGGTSVEVVQDRAVALPPLNSALAQALIERTRVARLLHGYRDVPAADLSSITHTLMALSQLLALVPELAEVDINPLVVNPEGALALDARIRLSTRRPAGAAHFAIRPYPEHLVETHVLRDGRVLTLRPIRPEDEPQHLAFLRQVDPEDIRLRVFHSRRSIEHTELARLTQIDYDREMAFVGTLVRPDGGEDTIGAVRGISDPDNVAAEFGVLIRSDMKGFGLGRLFMDKLIRYLRAHGTQRVEGTVLRENTGMLTLGRRLGFQIVADPEDPSLRLLTLPLQDTGHPTVAGV